MQKACGRPAPTARATANQYDLQNITARSDFRPPVREVFAHLSRHENLSAIFGLPIETIVRANDASEPYGVGSVRSIRVGPVRFEKRR